MKQLAIVWLLLLPIIDNCFAQEIPGARQIALAHSNSTYNTDAFSIFTNAAGLNFIKQGQISLYYSPAPYDVKELANGAFAYCHPTNAGNFALGFSFYGFELYKEYKFALAYCNSLLDNFTVGLTAIYQNLSIKNYGNKGILLFNGGVVLELTNSIAIGVSIDNFTRSSYTNQGNEIPTVFFTSTHYKVSNEIVVSCAVKKESGFDPSLRFGFEYELLKTVFLRIGSHSEPNTICGGFGILYNIIEADYAITSHPLLGLTHQFGLIINFSR